MIGKLKGVIDSYGDEHVILDVHGVGYLVHCSSRTLQALPQAGEAATLFIETIVREDMIRLFGFATALEKDWFNILLGVQGVGQKVALAILSTLKPGELANAIAMKDKAAISHLRGGAEARGAHLCGTEGQGSRLRVHRSGRGEACGRSR
jgi:holliday junction DNA helicase RuvA